MATEAEKAKALEDMQAALERALVISEAAARKTALDALFAGALGAGVTLEEIRAHLGAESAPVSVEVEDALLSSSDRIRAETRLEGLGFTREELDREPLLAQGIAAIASGDSTRMGEAAAAVKERVDADGLAPFVDIALGNEAIRTRVFDMLVKEGMPNISGLAGVASGYNVSVHKAVAEAGFADAEGENIYGQMRREFMDAIASDEAMSAAFIAHIEGSDTYGPANVTVAIRRALDAGDVALADRLFEVDNGGKITPETTREELAYSQYVLGNIERPMLSLHRTPEFFAYLAEKGVDLTPAYARAVLSVHESDAAAVLGPLLTDEGRARLNTELTLPAEYEIPYDGRAGLLLRGNARHYLDADIASLNRPGMTPDDKVNAVKEDILPYYKDTLVRDGVVSEDALQAVIGNIVGDDIALAASEKAVVVPPPAPAPAPEIETPAALTPPALPAPDTAVAPPAPVAPMLAAPSAADAAPAVDASVPPAPVVPEKPAVEAAAVTEAPPPAPETLAVVTMSELRDGRGAHDARKGDGTIVAEAGTETVRFDIAKIAIDDVTQITDITVLHQLVEAHRSYNGGAIVDPGIKALEEKLLAIKGQEDIHFVTQANSARLQEGYFKGFEAALADGVVTRAEHDVMIRDAVKAVEGIEVLSVDRHGKTDDVVSPLANAEVLKQKAITSEAAI